MLNIPIVGEEKKQHKHKLLVRAQGPKKFLPVQTGWDRLGRA